MVQSLVRWRFRITPLQVYRGVQRRRMALRRREGLSAVGSLGHDWPEYLMELGELGLYMFVMCAFATLLQHPAVRQFISNSVARRALMGLAMGATVIAIVMSPGANSREVISIRQSPSIFIG
jgi:hypothetical protein